MSLGEQQSKAPTAPQVSGEGEMGESEAARGRGYQPPQLSVPDNGTPRHIEGHPLYGHIRLPSGDELHMADLLPDGVIGAEGSGVIAFVNKEAERVLGVDRDDLIGTHLGDLDITDSDGNSWWDSLQRGLGHRSVTGHRERLAIFGGERHMLITMRYLRVGEDSPVVAMVLGLRSAEARLRAETDHAALISTVAHELRSPLGGIRGFARTLLRRWDDLQIEQRRTLVEAISSDADRLSDLIHDLLEVSRLDAGRVTLVPELTEIEPVITTVLERQYAAGTLDPSAITVDIDPKAPVVFCDPRRLDQVLANLIDNARTHGAPPIEISVESDLDASGTKLLVHVTVRDHGVGIPPVQRRMAFTRFWQAKSGVQGTTGLGLYIVRRLVEAQSGSVTIEDVAGSGLAVRVCLPAQPPRS